jgi:hypothetical protein
MGWRGTLVAASVASLLTHGFAAAKQRRDWVDPPADLPVAASPQPAPSLAPLAEPLPEDTAGEEAGPVGLLTAAGPPQVIRAGSVSSAGCAMRAYTVAPGATVRVHAC